MTALLEADAKALDRQEGYSGAEFDRGVSRLVERTIEELAEDRSLEPETALLGVVGIIRHRPELVRKLGRLTDGAIERHRESSLRRYHAQRAARREAERAELEQLIQAA